jgi:hypothetical protein
MLSSVVRVSPLDHLSRPTKRSLAADTLLAIGRLPKILREVFAEDQEMKRQAKQRYSFMSFDF